jgi:hypothetical protein
MSLKAMASPAAREPGPLVTFVRWRTVANVDSIVIWSLLRPVVHVEHEGVRVGHLLGGTGYLPPSIMQIFRRNDACSAGRLTRLAA